MATAAEATQLQDKSGALAAQQRSASIQRQQVKLQEQQRRKQAQEAMERRLAGRGFTGGSGFAEAQAQRLQTELQRGEQQRLADIDVAQAQAEAALREAEAQRQQQQQQFGATHGLSQQQLAQQQQQFEASLTEKTAAREQAQQFSYDQLSQQKDLALQELNSAVTAQDKQIAIQKLKLAQDATLEKQRLEHDQMMNEARNTLEYKKLAEEKGIKEAERNANWRIVQFQAEEQREALKKKYYFEDKVLQQKAEFFAQELGLKGQELNQAKILATEQLLWEKNKYTSEYAWRQKELISDQKFQIDLLAAKDKLATGQLILQEQIDRDAEERKLAASAFYNRGLAGEIVDMAGLSPTEVYSYQAGVAQMAKDDFDRELQNQLDLRANLISSAADPELSKRVLEIYERMFGISPQTGAGYMQRDEDGNPKYR